MAAKTNSLARQIWRARNAYLFLLPLFAGVLTFCYYPAFSGLFLSFFEKSSATPSRFVGFGNFAELFRDSVFTRSIGTMLLIMIPRLIIGILVPLVMAELIFGVKRQRGQKIYRILILLPIVAPGVVGQLIWKNIYDPNYGLLTSLLRGLGIQGKEQVIDWLGDSRYVIFSVVFMGFPWVGGTAVLIYMSGLMSIGTEMIEASLLDGAGTLRRIVSIDIPLIMGQIRYFLIFGIIGGLQDYGTQVVVTQGGPGDATYVPGYYMYLHATSFDRLGYASTIGTVIFLVIMALTAACFKFIKTKGLENY